MATLNNEFQYQIFRYTPELQKELRLETKAEPWLHCIIASNGEPHYGRSMLGSQNGGYMVAVYTWDSREVLEERAASLSDNVINILYNEGDKYQHAADNGQPLVGGKDYGPVLSIYMQKKNSPVFKAYAMYCGVRQSLHSMTKNYGQTMSTVQMAERGYYEAAKAREVLGGYRKYQKQIEASKSKLLSLASTAGIKLKDAPRKIGNA